MGPVVVEATLAAYDLRPLITGNWELLTPNHWGVIAGIATFTVTVTVVLVLVILGGTCSRLRDEAQEYEVKGVAAFKAPYQRFQLYDELLIAVATLPSKPSLSLLPQMGGKEMTGGSKRLDGLTVELHAYEPALHLDQLWAISCGKPVYAYGPFDPEECLWRFFDVGAPSSEVQTSATTDNASVIHSDNNTSGAANQSNVAAATTSTSPALTPPKEPTGIAGYAFSDPAALGAAPFMVDPGPRGLRMVVVDKATGYICGMASLLDNRPEDLSVRVGDVWLTPAFQRTHVHTDLCLCLLSYLFGLGYRRVERRCDAEDHRARKAIERAGFVLEGVLRKHRIVSGCNVDTALYALTNSDWRDAGKSRLSAKLRAPTGISGPTRPRGWISSVLTDAGGAKPKDA
jgi:RimJ/RimL family protein N-acetyltransferase